MKKVFTIFVAVLLTATVFAQAPQKMSYQAVIRNSSNALVCNQQIGMEINIRQGTPSGTVVYTETQTPTTNANGLVSIEIGGGIGLDTINWASDNYFIETKTAVVAPLTTYTITGVSQLLSVPYALNAKTADNGITGAQTTKLAGIVEGAEVNVQADWNQATTTADDFIKNKPSIPTAADGSETKVTAGTNVTVTGSGTTASPYVVNATGATALTIGQAYQGGIIFWLDATGQHGLIAATADQSTGIQWYNGTSTVTNAVRDGIDAGMYNTERIIANQGVGSYAAQLCANYQGGGYGDWYLPSKYELNLLYLQKTAVGGFASAYYWSSSESSSGNAWLQNFVDGFQSYGSKSFAFCVRAVRAF